MFGIEISFRRAVLETGIIVIGVLIALGADNWNSNRIDRRTEAEYLVRLASDASHNAELAVAVTGALERKLTRLDYLAETVVSKQVGTDPTQTVIAIGAGADLGWTFPRFRSITFEEMQSTGRLGLIQDTELRAALIQYDTDLSSTVDRIEARRTEFPGYAYSLLEPEDMVELNLIDLDWEIQEIEVDTALSQRVADAVRDPNFKFLLNAERNFASFAVQLMDWHGSRSEELLLELDRALQN